MSRSRMAWERHIAVAHTKTDRASLSAFMHETNKNWKTLATAKPYRDEPNYCLTPFNCYLVALKLRAFDDLCATFPSMISTSQKLFLWIDYLKVGAGKEYNFEGRNIEFEPILCLVNFQKSAKTCSWWTNGLTREDMFWNKWNKLAVILFFFSLDFIPFFSAACGIR
jgi:hypothetical protein